MIAAERGHAAVIEVLLRAGAEKARRDREGKTALDLAADRGDPPRPRGALGSGS